MELVVHEESHARTKGYISLKNNARNPFPLKSFNKFDNDPKVIGNVRAYSYVNHNPLFTVGPDCIF